jgi:hypothetical protein
MNDTLVIRRLKRLWLLFYGHARRALWAALPSLVLVLAGAFIGSSVTEARIHDDCKFMLAFRIGTTGYICEIGK